MNDPAPSDHPELPLDVLDQVDRICDRFEAAWDSGARPRIEDHLEDVGTAFRPELLRDLLAAEVAARRRRGEHPEPREYADRFPADREAIAAAFAEAPAPFTGETSTATGADVGESAGGIGDVNGALTPDGRRFRVLRPHARGGLGAVFVAVDRELHREVALKRMQRRHARDPASRSRFLQEAEITGGLEHPGIVPVYGLGDPGEDRPYYAMRFIRGDTLKQAIDAFHADESPRRDAGARSLALRQLLRRFIDACNAIDYAHGRGVLHRDIKPGNIIVGKHGETLVVDWGLAKSMGAGGGVPVAGEPPIRPSPAGDARTLPGSVMGTPSYMSPEQAGAEVDALGPRSDVYSLGATLYCLLTGRPPFDGEDVDAVLAAVRRGDVPPPRRLDPKLDRSLEAICLKAMRLRPEDRYESARALADDVERWMADEPVSAYSEPWSARARRWARRHRTVVVASAWLLAASVIGLAVGFLLLRDKQRQTDRARRIAVENQGLAVRAQRDADLARRDAEANFARALDAVETMLIDVSQEHLVNLPHFEPVRRRLLEDALAFHQGFLARAGDSPTVAVPSARAYRLAADIHRQLGRRDQARREFDEASRLLDRIAPGFERDVERSAIDFFRAELEDDEQHIPEAIAAFRRCLDRLAAIQDQAPGPETRRRLHELEATARAGLGRQLAGINQFVEASRAFRAARATLEQLIEAEPSRETFRYTLVRVEHTGASIDYQRNEVGDSIDGWRRAVRLLEDLLRSEPDSFHYRSALALMNNRLAVALARLRRSREAIDASRQAIDLYRQLAADYPAMLEFRAGLAAAHHQLGAVYHVNHLPERARTDLRLSIEAQGVLVRREPDNPGYLRDMANSSMLLGNAERTLGDLDASERHLAMARDGFAEAVRLRPAVPGYRSDLASAEHNRALTLERAGDLERAEQGYRAARRILDDLMRRHPENLLYVQNQANVTGLLGRCLLAQGKRAEGAAELARDLALWDRVHRPSAGNPGSLDGRGRTWMLLGRIDEAVRAAEALAALRGPGGRASYQAARILAFNLPRPGSDPLAVARVPADRADELARRAMRLLGQAIAQGAFRVAEIENHEDFEALRGRAEFPGLLERALDRDFPADPIAR